MDYQHAGYDRYVLPRSIFYIPFIIKILMWFVLFYLAIAEWEAQRRQLFKEKKKTFFNTFEVDMALLITSKPASISCFRKL